MGDWPLNNVVLEQSGWDFWSMVLPVIGYLSSRSLSLDLSLPDVSL